MASPISSYSSDESSVWCFGKPLSRLSSPTPSCDKSLSAALEEGYIVQPAQKPHYKKLTGLDNAIFERTFALQPAKHGHTVHETRLMIKNLPSSATYRASKLPLLTMASSFASVFWRTEPLESPQVPQSSNIKAMSTGWESTVGQTFATEIFRWTYGSWSHRICDHRRR